MRDVWRRGSGLTLRRLWVLLMGLPAESEFWRSYHRAQAAALTDVDRQRERMAHYNKGGS